MNRSLNYYVNTVFTRDVGYRHCYKDDGAEENFKYMEIPINQDTFLMPLFAFNGFIYLLNMGLDSSTEIMVANLYDAGHTSYYKSFDRCLKDIIIEDFEHSRLVKILASKGKESVVYYGTKGAIFDKDFKPVMICSWKMQKVYTDKNHVKYRQIQPLVIIDPTCFINQEDSMQRWIVKKFSVESLKWLTDRLCPGWGKTPSQFDLSDNYKTEDLKVEISNMPFKVRTVDIPSMSTTNELLIQTVLSHMEETVQ